MRKIIVTEYLTLDGVMEAPHKWHNPWWSGDILEYKSKELSECDALLLGRVTYEEFASVWPTMKDEIGYADKMNSMHKYVVSKTPVKTDWNNTQVIKEDIMKELGKLKEEQGQSILVFGSATLVNSLLESGLIDEYRLMVFPLVLGSGKRLWSEKSKISSLKLIDTQTFSTGVVNLIYRKE